MRGPAHQILDELSRRTSGMVRIGIVHEVDHPNTRIRVRIDNEDNMITGWVPWPAVLGRNRVEWMPLKVGQLVLLACQSGDLDKAFVVAFLYDVSDPPPSTDDTLDIVRFRSGTTVQHDADTGDLLITAARDVTVQDGRHVVVRCTDNVTVVAGGNATINATGNVDIDGARIDLN